MAHSDQDPEFDVTEWASAQHRDDTEEIRLLRKENSSLRQRLTVAGKTAGMILGAVEAAFDEELPRISIPKPKRAGKGEEEIPLLHVSDTQLGKTTETYDTAIGIGRLKELADKTAKIIEQRKSMATIKELRLYLGGDMVEGEVIFPHQPHLIDTAVIEQSTRDIPHAITEMVIRLLSVVEKVHIVAVPGNHGRPASKHSGSHPDTNWDSVAYRIVQMMLEGTAANQRADVANRVTFNIPTSWYALDTVFNTTNLMLHGHQIRGMIGGPAFARQMMGWRDAIKEPWHNLYFGHFHVYKQGDLNGRWWFCNGTTESDNDYALERLSSSTTPRQRLQFFNAKHGMIADMPIFLTYGLNGDDGERAA